MDRRRALLALTTVLFVGWMAYLIHLALTHRHPTVISRPQILVSQLIVIGNVPGDDVPRDEVTVKKTLLSEKGADDVEPGTKIRVPNLPLSAKSWTGPGDYLLPLIKDGDDYLVTPIPRSPGFVGVNAPPPIYRWTPEIEEQFKQVPKPQSAAVK
jgi:hypothetical protein